MNGPETFLVVCAVVGFALILAWLFAVLVVFMLARPSTRVLLLAAVTGILAGVGGIVDAAPVAAHHAGPHLPGDPMNYPVQARIAARGYVTYCLDATTAAYPRFREQAASVTAYAASRGMPPAFEVPWGAGCDVRWQAPAHTVFVGPNGCNSSGAYACIYYWRDAVDVYIDLGAGGTRFTYNDSTICHEGINTGHLMFIHEHYDDINFVSLGRAWTCMDFGVRDPNDSLGRNVWALPDYDRDRIFNAFVPDRPSEVGLTVEPSGWLRVNWGQTRADGGAAHVNRVASNTSATYASFAWSPTPSDTPEWVGTWLCEDWGCGNAPFRGGVQWFDPSWAGCLWIRAENAAFYWVPQVSAPLYWTLAGCTFTPPAMLSAFGQDNGDATCIGWHESRFAERARNTNTNGSEDRGAFQINSVHDGTLPSLGFTPSQMFEYGPNSAVARELSRRHTWRIWSTARLCGLS